MTYTNTIKGNKIPLRGEISLPGDKSISHRAVILGAIAKGTTRVKGFLLSEDTLSTKNALLAMGANILSQGTELKIKGKGLYGLVEPKNVIDARNSGTTARLLTGLLSAQNFTSTITGDKYLRKRPMNRVIKPLSMMNAKITSTNNDLKLPITIEGTNLKSISYTMSVASAQVKSSIILAALYADGITEIIETIPTRDHTERMLKHLKYNIVTNKNTVTVCKSYELKGSEIIVPSDISSAAYFIVAALINPNSEILIYNVGVNPYRTGILDVLSDMGASIQLTNKRIFNGEPIADIEAKSSLLKGVEIKGDIIPRLIDEIPILAVAACFAEGTTLIKDASELRVKESDRIKAMASELQKLGANIEELEDGMIINGREDLKGSVCTSWGDHRVAMSIAVAGTNAGGETIIENSDSVTISFPQFFSILQKLRS